MGYAEEKDFREDEEVEILRGHICNMISCLGTYPPKSLIATVVYKVDRTTWPGTHPGYPDYFITVLDGLEGGPICASALKKKAN